MSAKRRRPGNWRRAAAAAMALAIVAGVGVAWWARATVPAADVVVAARPLAPPSTPAVSPSAPAPAPGSHTPANIVVPYVAPPPVKATAGIGAQAAADYRRRARYPRWAQPLMPEDQDPIVRDREVSPVESRGRNGEEPTLRVFPAAMGFESPEPAIVYAELTTKGRAVAPTTIRGTLTTEELAPLAEVKFHDDGLDGDAAAGDGRYTVTFPGDTLGGALSRSYLVQVEAKLDGDDVRKAATSFMYASPHAQLTGNYRDAVTDGNLVVGVEIEVSEAGRFHVEATLYGPDGLVKIAWAQAAQWLEPGTHWLDLGYYGLILRERGIDGPYVLRYVALSTTSEMPNAKNRVVENAYTTGAYQSATFSDRPFNDPQLLDAAKRVEEDPMPAGLDAGG